MNYKDFQEYFLSVNPKPTKPNWFGFLFRVDFILLMLAAIGGVLFSAFRTYTLIAEQSGSFVALFAVFALEFSLTGLLLSQSRKSNNWLIKGIRAGAVWITITILLLILVVTNASYEIKQVGLVISDSALNIILVVFLGVMIPILVVVNLENLAVRVPEFIDENKERQAQYYKDLDEWNKKLQAAWETERKNKQPKVKPKLPEKSYSKEERLNYIRKQLDSGLQLNKSKLAKMFNVSTTTIFNDVKEVENERESQF